MILLPNGCMCSKLAVSPKNWKTCGVSAIKKPWRIHYRFYDPSLKGTKDWGKLIPIKGMNRIKDLEQRREAVRILLEDELYQLKVKGLNPITKTYIKPEVDITYEIDPDTPFSEALEAVFKKLRQSDKTKMEIKSAMKYFLKSVSALRYDAHHICDIRRKHVRAILDHQSVTNGYSNNRYNSVRSYISMLFAELVEYDAVEINPVSGISKRKTVKRIRKILGEVDLERIKVHLHEHHYTFYRYMEIFYFSGCRSAELMGLQGKDVDLKGQVFKVTVKKGGDYVEELRAININCLVLWKELLRSCHANDYVFSKGLEPGPEKISSSQITRRWKRNVKDALGIEEDFYALKHLHTSKVIDLYGAQLAANMNGHKSTRMNEQHYDVMRQKRMLEEAKHVDVAF